MATFRMLSENFFNTHQFASHTITASTYQAGNEPWRIGTGRRSSRNAWIAPTTGEQTVKVTCDQVRGADMIALDRGHNIQTLKVQFTNSTAAGWTTHETITIPTATYGNSRLSDSPGARTPDGSWVYRFATTVNMPVAKNWRLAVSTTAGAFPKIVGAYLGKSFSAEALRPWDDDTIQMQRAEVSSPELWTAASQVAARRVGTLSARLSDKQGDQARYHIGNRFWRGDVAWIVPHEDQAERAALATAPAGANGMPYDQHPTRVLSLGWVEHQPKPR